VKEIDREDTFLRKGKKQRGVHYIHGISLLRLPISVASSKLTIEEHHIVDCYLLVRIADDGRSERCEWSV
jgi:hypothetical protein